MPLSPLQSEIVRMIAPLRSETSYIAGGTPINLHGPRFSTDIDIFHPRSELADAAAAADIARLQAAGLSVEVFRQIKGMTSANVASGNEMTKVEWVTDSDFRYFPPMADALFGFVLHPADLAVNKMMAAAGRHVVRDIVDLLTIHESYLSAGAIALAAVVVSPGFTPESLLTEVQRNANYPAIDFAEMPATQPIDGAVVLPKIRKALEQALAFVMRVPSEKVGRLFLENGRPVEPDLARLDSYTEHEPTRGGHWPSSSEIGSAMLERYVKK